MQFVALKTMTFIQTGHKTLKILKWTRGHMCQCTSQCSAVLMCFIVSSFDKVLLKFICCTWHDEDTESGSREEAGLDAAGDAVSDGEHGGQLGLVDAEVRAQWARQPLVLGPELLALQRLRGRDGLHGRHGGRGPQGVGAHPQKATGHRRAIHYVV